MDRFCPMCGVARTDGSSLCGQCGHNSESAPISGVPDNTLPPPMAPPPASPIVARPKRQLTFGQKLSLGLFLIGFALVSFVVIGAQVRARHPHHYHHY